MLFRKKKKLIYSEDDILGGNDPYSGSKASVEILFNTYFNSYFKLKKNIKLCTVRAGNVIGGVIFLIKGSCLIYLEPFKTKKN